MYCDMVTVVPWYRFSGIALWVCFIWCIHPYHGGCSIIFGDEYSQQILSDTIHYCVDMSTDDSICSTDPVITLEGGISKRSLNAFNVGVTQTIDGTEDEKNSIRKVLTQMNNYWYNEVLSNFEYDEARASW